MKKTVLSVFLLIFSLSVLFGQTSEDTITIKKVFGSYYFYQNGKKMNLPKLVKTMQPNEKAYKEIKAAQTNNIIASIIGGTGAFMLGWQVGGALAGAEFDWTMAGIGSALIVVSIPISLKYVKQAKSAIRIYNEDLREGSTSISPQLNFTCSSGGVGLLLKF